MKKENDDLKKIGPTFIGGESHPIEENVNKNMEEDYNKLKTDYDKLNDENKKLKED